MLLSPAKQIERASALSPDLDRAGLALIDASGCIHSSNSAFGHIEHQIQCVSRQENQLNIMPSEQFFSARNAAANGRPVSYDVACGDGAVLQVNTLPVSGGLVAVILFLNDAPPAIPHLSNRELDLLRLSSKGYRRDRISHELGISVATVDFHAANLRRKLNARTTIEAVMIATRLGLLT